MPMKTKGKRIAKRRAYRPRTGYRSRLAKSEFASMKETYEFATLDNNTGYIDYENALARNSRASQIAQGYREYRITKVEYIFKPTLDTFQGPMLGGSTIPYLYAMVDRVGALADFTTADQLREMGAKPRRLDDKSLRVVFKPAVLEYTLDKNGSSNQFARPLVSPWLSTDKNNSVDPAGPGWAPSSIDHLGLAWILESGGGNTVLNQYNVEVVTHFQFRKPNLNKPVGMEGVDGKPPAKQVVGKTA